MFYEIIYKYEGNVHIYFIPDIQYIRDMIKDCVIRGNHIVAIDIPVEVLNTLTVVILIDIAHKNGVLKSNDLDIVCMTSEPMSVEYTIPY